MTVAVHNIGLTATQAGQFTMHVMRSPPKSDTTDYAYNNPDETTQIGPDQSIPALAPGATTLVTIPLTSLAGNGVYALSFQLQGGMDANPSNMSLVHHAHIGVP